MKAILTIIIWCFLVGSASAQTWQTLYSNSSWIKDSDCCGAASEMRQAMPSLPVAIQSLRVTYGSAHGVVTAFAHVTVCSEQSASTCKTAPVEETCSGAPGLTLAAGAANALCDPVPISMQAGEVPLIGQKFTGGNGQASKYSSPMTTYYGVNNPSPSSWNLATMTGPVSSTVDSYAIVMVEYLPATAPPPPPPPPPSVTMTAPGIPGGGRLTIAHGVSRLFQDTVATFIDYAPDSGTLVPVVDASGGGHMIPFVSSSTDVNGWSLSLTAAWPANSMFDVYAAYNSGAGALCTGQAWSNSITPPVADALVNGIRVNAASFAPLGCNVVGVTCPQNQCAYLGTIMTSAAGTVECLLSGGQNRHCGIWNKDNQIQGTMIVFNPGSTSPVYNLPQGAGSSNYVWQPLGADQNNSAIVMAGRIDGRRVHMDASVDHRNVTPAGGGMAYAVSVGWGGKSCANPAGDYSQPTFGTAGISNQEFPYPSSIMAMNTISWCDPPAFQGVNIATLLEYQVWGAGQEWIRPDNDNLRIEFWY